MKIGLYPSLRKSFARVSFIIFLLLNSCSHGPWRSVNVGREYGPETTPWVVSHLPEKNRWVIARTKSHNIFQRIICFNYQCRRMIGHRKALHTISYKNFVKQIKKNAKKRFYKNMVPVVSAAPAIKKPFDDPARVSHKKDTAKKTLPSAIAT